MPVILNCLKQLNHRFPRWFLQDLHSLVLRLPSTAVNNQTFSSNIVFVAHNMGWPNEQTMFDQTLSRVSPHYTFCVLPLKLWCACPQIRFWMVTFSCSSLLFEEVAKRLNICSWSKMLDENVWSRSNMGSHSRAMLREVAKRSNILGQWKCWIVNGRGQGLTDGGLTLFV